MQAAGIVSRPSRHYDTRHCMGTFLIPAPQADDSEDVSWALSTATALLARGESTEALRWLRRAAENASEAGSDDRALELFKCAADMASKIAAVPSLPPQPPVRTIPQAPPGSLEQPTEPTKTLQKGHKSNPKPGRRQTHGSSKKPASPAAVPPTLAQHRLPESLGADTVTDIDATQVSQGAAGSSPPVVRVPPAAASSAGMAGRPSAPPPPEGTGFATFPAYRVLILRDRAELRIQPLRKGTVIPKDVASAILVPTTDADALFLNKWLIRGGS